MTDNEITSDDLQAAWNRKTLAGYVPDCLPTGSLACDECGCRLTLDCWLTGLDQIDSLYCDKCHAYVLIYG